MLEELKWVSYHWSEETSIGRIVLKYAPDLVKAYPPFVNFFENMKDMLVQCDREKPRWGLDYLKYGDSRKSICEAGETFNSELWCHEIWSFFKVNATIFSP